jgi:fructose-bisphosphate aldolase, class II
MIVSLCDVLKTAEKNNCAVGAFNVPNWESAEAIIEAAEETDKPVILNYAPLHTPFMNMEDAAEIMKYFANKAKVPVCVHLDHGDSFETCIKAIRLGFTSVMIDASAQPYEKNIQVTAEVVKAAHAAGVSVEAELGHIFVSVNGVGKAPVKVETKDSFDDVNDVYTRPEMAKDFAGKTGVDALAIAFGTSHGIYVTKPVLDLARISQIKKAVNMPFVMHGGSGLSKEEFQTAIHNGIRKINYYTYMTLSGGKAVKAALDKFTPNDNIFFHDIPGIAIKAMKENVKQAILIFSNEI